MPNLPQAPRRLADALALDLVLALAAVLLLSLAGTAAFLWQQINHNFDEELVESAHRLMDVAMHQIERDLGQGQGQGQPQDHMQQASAAHAVASASASAPAPALPPASSAVPHPALRAPSHPLLSDPPLYRSDTLIFQVVDAQARVWLRTQAAPIAAFEVPLAEGFHALGGWRIYVAPHPSQPLYLLLADPMAERTEAVLQGTTWLAAIWAVMLLVLTGLLVLLARRRLRVLDGVQQQISTRSGRQLSPLSTEGLPAELADLTRDVNALLVRLNEALQVERALAANAAHELRTPLAAAQLRLATAMAEGLNNPHVAAAHTALGTLQHRTEKLLQLSRAESAHALHLQCTDLNALASQVAQEAWGQWPAAQRQLDLQLAEEAPPPLALAEPDALAIALRNLIENALRYAPQADITLAVLPPATVLVRDTGPGVPAERLGHLRERHVRASADRAGFGLGLSIVASVADKHDAQLVLRSPPEGQTRGFEARLVLQATSPDTANANAMPHA